MQHHFPGSDAPGTPREVDPAVIWCLTSSSDPIADEALAEMVAEHHTFLACGGGGGEWELTNVAGLLPLCLYWSDASDGAQLVLRHAQIMRGAHQLRGRDLSWADLSACLAEGVDFTGSRLDGSMAIDSIFAGADFSHASLRGVDLSGSDLRNARFIGADLAGASLERANCAGADFTGASIERAHFPGAVLDGAVPPDGRAGARSSIPGTGERRSSAGIRSGQPQDQAVLKPTGLPGFRSARFSG